MLRPRHGQRVPYGLLWLLFDSRLESLDGTLCAGAPVPVHWKAEAGHWAVVCPTINLAAPEAMTSIEDQTGPSLGKPQCGPQRETPKLCGRTCHLLRPKWARPNKIRENNDRRLLEDIPRKEKLAGLESGGQQIIHQARNCFPVRPQYRRPKNYQDLQTQLSPTS